MTRPTAKPRKRKTTIEEIIPDGEVLGEESPLSEFDVSLEAAEDSETLKSVLEQFGVSENVLFRYYRQMPNGPPAFCFESQTFDEAFVQRERGAGIYIARIFINGRFKRNMTFQVDEPANGIGSKPNGNGSSSHEAFLEKMLMVLLTRESGGSHAPSLTDLTAALANLDGLRGKQDSGIDLLMKGIELARSIEPGGSLDWKGEMVRMAKDALPAITGIVSNQLVARNGGGNLQPPPANPEQPAPVNGMPTPEQQEEHMKLMLKQAIGMLKSQLMSGVSVDSLLDLIMANRGNMMYQPLIFSFASQTFEELVALDAEIGKEPLQSQFRALHDGLRSELAGDDSMGDDSERDLGNVSDIGSHGGTGKARA